MVDGGLVEGHDRRMSQFPLIGISGNIFPAVDRRFYKNKELIVVERSMANAIEAAGGVPISLPVTANEEYRSRMAETLDGLLLSGGTDVDPSSYGQSNDRWPGQPERDDFESALLHALRAQGKPVLGVCRGHQLINVAFGGTLIPDILTDREGCHEHRSQELYCSLRHPIEFKEGTALSQIFAEISDVNTVHHQAIDRLADGLEAIAWSDDGLIEAVQATDGAWTWGVQWHPEWDPRRADQALFAYFLDRVFETMG